MTVRFRVIAIASIVALPLQLTAQAPGKQIIGTSTATLSQAVRYGDLVFSSGQLGGRDSTIQGQTTAALATMKTVFEQAGTNMGNVLKCTVFLVDTKDFQGMNTAYAAAFPKEPPARSTVIVAALVTPVAKVEIECIAGMPKP